jgi:hypothetical protein
MKRRYFLYNCRGAGEYQCFLAVCIVGTSKFYQAKMETPNAVEIKMYTRTATLSVWLF